MVSRRGRVLFGPLLYSTLVVAGLILAGLGLWSLWPTWRQSWHMRTYAAELRGPSPLFARRAAGKLAQAGPAAVPWLAEAARDPDARVRSLAFSTLGDTRPASKAAVEALIGGLRDDDARARYEAADALGRLGPDAASAAEALAGALEDGDPGVRLRSARCSGGSGGKRVSRHPRAAQTGRADGGHQPSGPTRCDRCDRQDGWGNREAGPRVADLAAGGPRPGRPP